MKTPTPPQTTQTNTQTPVGSKDVFVQPTMTESALLDELRKNKGARIVTIVTSTTPRMRKSNPFDGNIRKVSRTNGMLNWHYARAVNRQRDREGKETNFEAQPRKWGTRIQGTPLIEHKGNFYIEMKVENAIEYRYETLDGQPINKDDVKPHLYARSKPKNQEVENPIILKDYKVGSIASITMDGETRLIRR